MRRLLMVTYFFPPVGGVGIERTVKHAAYLPEHGWQPVVVAPENSAYRIVNPSSLDLIPPGTEVHRAATLEPGHVRRGVARFIGSQQAEARGGRGGHEGARDSGGRLMRAVNAAWSFAVPKLFFPDDQLLWAPGAIRAGQRAHRRAPVDAVYSSSPPISGHLAAGILARQLGVPWVADFRDPWIGNAFAAPLPGPYRAVQRHLESWIVRRADRVILATKGYRDRYSARYPQLRERFVHLPNGYDAADLGTPRPRRAAEQYRLIYAGSVYGDRELSIFLDGLELALQRDPSLRDRLRIEFVGWFNAPNQAVAARRLPALQPLVQHRGYRPREDVIAMERAADAGLILMADGPDRDAVVAAKLYEYLGLDLPVLAIVPPGETREILRELDWGVATDPTPSGVADGIAAIMARPRATRVADPEGRYDRRTLSARLASLLDELVSPRP